MRCHEAEGLLAPQLSDCLDAAAQRELALHLEGCPACRARLQQEYELDRLVVAAVNRETPSAEDLVARIEKALDRQPRRVFSLLQWRWRWPAMVASAAAIVLFAVGISRLTPRNSMHLLCQDAVDDHRAEVVMQQPREWATGNQEIADLVRQVRVGTQVPLVLAGLPLKKARICGLLDATALHLVYGNGTKEISVFLMPRQELPPDSLPARTALVERVHQEKDAGIAVTSFGGNAVGVVVVGDATVGRQIADQLQVTL